MTAALIVTAVALAAVTTIAAVLLRRMLRDMRR